MTEPTREERLYRLTVRTLYVIALALNAVIVYEQVKETEEGKALAARWGKMKDKALRQYRDAKNLRAAENWVVFEAMTILEEEGTSPDA
jgi:hypothetical protein